jgi:outer membrane cobalamin receptor
MSPRSLLAFGAVAVLLARSPAARADGTEDLEGVLSEPIVSTASQTAETQSLAPATSSILSAEDLRRYGIRSLDEAINFLSLGMVTTSASAAAEVGARGVLVTTDYGNHVLLLVNGHTVNEPWNGTAYFERGAGIPFELIDHIEIILGPGSVLYGSSAMLGVVNVVTKRAKDYRGLHLVVDGSLSPSTGGGGELRSPPFDKAYGRDLGRSVKIGAGLGYELSLFGTPSEVTFQVEYFAQSGPALYLPARQVESDAVTGGPRYFGPHNPPGSWGGAARDSIFTRVPAAHLRFVSGGWEINARGATYARGIPAESYVAYDDGGSGELDRLVSLDVRYKTALSRALDISVRGYGDLYDYAYDVSSPAAESCLEGQVGGCRQRDLGRSRWIGAEVQLAFDWLSNDQWKTLVGVDGRVRNIRSHYEYIDAVTGENPGNLGEFEITEKVLALYAQQVARPVPWLTLNAGVRGDIEERFGRASPRIAASARTWRDATLKAVYAEAFRTPSSYERLYEDRLVQMPAPDLRPETVRSAEISLEQRFGAHRILFGAFRSWWRDMISLQTLSPDELADAIARGTLDPSATTGQQYRNIASIDDYGWNGAIDGALGVDRFRYGVNVTGSYARQDPGDGSGSTPLTVGPAFFGNARASYDLGGDLPTIALAAHYAGKRAIAGAFSGAFPPAWSSPHFETRATVSGDVRALPGLSYRFSANYAFNAKGPYAAAPVASATPEVPVRDRIPIERLRLMLGLEYVWDMQKTR